jgi:hypothetical protein
VTGLPPGTFHGSSTGTGGRPAGYRQTEGDGRNNYLFALKWKLFYEEGWDEDDPRLIRAIYQANVQFDEPLDESEVEHTILRPKGFRRHGRCNPEPPAMAEPGVPAGSEVSVPKEDLEKVITAHREVKKRSDLSKPKYPRRLDTVARVEAKLRAEADAHPWSLDWAHAPDGTWDLGPGHGRDSHRGPQGRSPAGTGRLGE